MQDIFIADCKREMYIRKLSNSDLARLTGYKKSTIEAFFTDKVDRARSQNVAQAIAAVLQLKI